MSTYNQHDETQARLEADYRRLQLEHNRLTEQYTTLKDEWAQTDQERVYLKETLSRFEQDLRALQATRTVRLTHWLGDVIRELGGRVQGIWKDRGKQQTAISNQQLADSRQQTANPQPLTPNPQTPSPSYDSWFWERYSLDAEVNVREWDFSAADLERNRALQAAHQGRLEINSLTWFLPPFQHAYYGGIHTILRFAAYFKEQYGVESRFVIVRPHEGTPQTFSHLIEEAFPNLHNAPVSFVQNYTDLDNLPPSDGVVATLWTTAYYALRFNQTKRKFYFIQDYEPLFYPAGSSQALVEATYRFGFVGLTNTISLQQLYEQQYDGLACAFTPAVNTALFYPATEPTATTEPLMLFFYGRPGQPRNGFELGTAALRTLKKRLGEKVRIVTAGSNWLPSQYGLEGIVENLGLLPYEETAELYRTCAVGFVLMFTRHPSYPPLEMMASGCLVVTNQNSATRWLLKDGENCLLSEVSATSLAQTLERALTEPELRHRITAQALATIQQQYADWPAQMAAIYQFMGSSC